MDQEERSLVRQLTDRMEIEKAILWWTRNVDRGQPAEALAFFSDDCIVDYGVASGGPLRGKDAYLAFMSESFLPTPPGPDSLHGLRVSFCVHHVANLEVDFVSADEARAEWHSIGLTERPDGRRGMGWSRFEDEFLRTTEGWRIIKRTRTSLARHHLTQHPPLSVESSQS
jgi:hypothetical protein